MKAAVLHNFGDTPRYENFPDPIPVQDEILIQVKAIVLENVNKMMANGTHYSSRQFYPGFPAIIGFYGSFAEKAVVPAAALMPVPEGVDAAVAAALPSPVLTSLLPLKYTARLQQGETVLINGATGVSGKIAIQVAKLLGAGKIIGTGRNEAILETLSDLGADAVINLKGSEAAISESFKKEAGETGYDIVLDFIWGKPAELLIKTFVPKILGLPKRSIRYIHIGEKAGSTISISGESLRTSGLEIYGASNIPPAAIPEALNQAWEWIKDNKFQIDIEKIPLSEIQTAWQRENLDGKRLVIVP